MVLNIRNTDICEKLNLSVDAWKLISINTIEIIQIELKPGEQISEHINPNNVVFYVLQGSGTLTVSESAVKLQTGDCIAVEKNLKRSWTNTSEKNLKLLVVKEL